VSRAGWKRSLQALELIEYRQNRPKTYTRAPRAVRHGDRWSVENDECGGG
jgi:hypothetical protein